MLEKNQRKFLLLIGSLTAVALIIACVLFYNYSKIPERLEVDYLDVGQGDAELIKTPGGQNILIDGGPDETVLRRLGENLSWFDRRIDLMILTHPHADHLTGQIEVLKRYQVGKIIYTGVTDTTPNYLAWLEAVKSSQAQMLIADHYQKIVLGPETYLELLYPLSNLADTSVKNLNNTSIISRLVYGKNKFLFMGDAQSEEEKVLINKYDLVSDVLKVGHHGSKYSTINILNYIKPKFCMIEVGQDNQFGHPHQETINALKTEQCNVYRTDLERTIKIMSDGQVLKIK